ncbi:MAG: penicillin acylase family protein [Nitrososphaerota archaeon]|nr:penicillin acylase family protein [Nitrososphaerota archaeon]
MKIRWLITIFVVILLASYISTNFTLLSPRLGVWSSINSSSLSSGTMNVPGLSNPVNVTIDESGVAHISASSVHDMFYAQGYYSASQRLFQMELEALLASGNLSRYVGSSGVNSDITMRLIGLPENALALEKAYAANYPTFYQYLLDYSQGVNAYINQSESSTHLGFKLLGISPFHWSVFYTLCWEEYMAWSLTTGAAEPLQSDLFYNQLGFSNAALLWPYYPYFTENITVVPGDGTVNGYSLSSQGVNVSYFWSQNWYSEWATGVSGSLLKSLTPLIRDALANISDPYVLPGVHSLDSFVGSNSWVVTANYSQSGFPILANDPHLPLLAPSVWIPMQLEAPGFNVTGWDLAGVPGILIGHTQYTSWGLTTPEGNSANEYLEVLNGNSYLYDGTWHPMSVYNYTLLGKTHSVYYTNNGPLIARNPNYGISLNWARANSSYDLLAELQLDQSQNFNDMLNALKSWGSPPQNFAMVSSHDAGYITAGAYPIINETLPDGKQVQVVGSRSLLNGTISQYEPAGYVPFQYLPQVTNAPRGYMFAPNQPTVSLNYPYPFVGGFWASGGRAEIISRYLESHPSMSLQEMMNLQSNVSDYWASLLTPYLVNALQGMSMNSTEQQAFNYLKTWNYTTYQSEVGITVYWYLTSEMYNQSFDRIYAQNNLTGLPSPFTSTLIYLAETNQSSQWFNGNFTSLVRDSFQSEVGLLSQKLGLVDNWTWGGVHKVEIASMTGLAALSIGPISIWGDDHTVSVGGVPSLLQVPERYVSVGSSLREVSSPGTGQFYGVFPGGPSENVLSYYFSNQLNYWIYHEYYNMSEQKTQVTIRYE